MSHCQGVFMSREKKDSVGERIQLVRGGLGVAEFATELGVNRKTVTRWEANEALPDGASLLSLMNKFNANPAWVLTGEGGAPALKPDEAALLDNYRHCSVEGKNAVKTTVSCLAQSGKVVKKGKAA